MKELFSLEQQAMVETVFEGSISFIRDSLDNKILSRKAVEYRKSLIQKWGESNKKLSRPEFILIELCKKMIRY